MLPLSGVLSDLLNVSMTENLGFSINLRHQFIHAYILLWLSVIIVIKHERHFGTGTRSSVFAFKVSPNQACGCILSFGFLDF